MNVNIKDMGEKIKAFFTAMDKKTRRLLAIVLVLIAAGAVLVAFLLNNRPYEVLFTGLSGDEASTIVRYLEENGYSNYRLEGTGTILVPSNQEAQLKARLLMEGYPKSGFAYETYRSGMGAMATAADRNIAYLQDLQDRMAAVIRCMDGVKDAVVTIVQGEDRAYVLDSANITEASASVMVTMQGGGKLPAQLAEAIRNLVSRAVKGLSIDNIAITDSLGNLYSGGDLAAGTQDASLLKLRLEEEVNNSVRTQVMQVLAPLYGTENVQVGVNSTVDVSHVVGESTKYTEPDWAADGSTRGEGIIGSQIYDQELIRGEEDPVGGVVGTESNADLNTYVRNNAQASGEESYIRNSGEVQYNVDTDRQQVERVAGIVTDVMVSVSINSTVASGVVPNQLMNHVARAAGIASAVQEEKISILIAPFYSPAAPGVLPDPALLQPWVIYAGLGGLALLVLLLVIFGLLRGRKRKKKGRELEELLTQAAAVGAVPVPEGANLMAMRTERSMELRQDVRQFAEENPEIAAQMLKSWLRGGEDRDG